MSYVVMFLCGVIYYSLLIFSFFLFFFYFFFFKQKTAYEMRISDWSSDVCSSDLFGGGLLHHRGARIIVLVNPVAKAHQAERIVLVLGAGDIFRNPVGRANFPQHVERSLVRAAMRRAPQTRSEERRVGKEWVSTGRSRWSPYH